jgi:lysozyme family protein
MSSSFVNAWSRTAQFEKGYSDNPRDAGGPTNHGITEAEARACGYEGDMRDLPPAVAMEIGKQRFWDTLSLDRVAPLSETVAQELFDTGMNCGRAAAGRFLQRALNLFNHNGKDYPDLTVDGLVGPMTIYALKRYLAMRNVNGETVLLRALNAQQGDYYMSITAGRPKNEDFIYGWFLNRVQI